ncbi:MAG: AsmA family protein [Lewinellaceae bacterium]|nr:AsmA family protein [Lewinellaceae bacterium]
MKTILWKIAKYTGATFASILLLLFLLPILFPGTIAEQIKTWTNQSIEGEINFSKVRLSFFRHFPTLTLTLFDFSLTGAAPFANDTLIAGEALSFGIDLASVFSDSIEVKQFFVDNAFINVQVDEQGNANYNVYKGGNAETTADTSTARLNIERILINNSRLVYHDRSVPMLLKADGFRYEGRGDLASSQFDLQSHLQAEKFDFAFDNTTYIDRRNVQAELITGINTASLEFKFSKNNLLIGKLPVDFTGAMAILKDGYDIDLDVVSGTTDFGNIFSALPPEYDDWFAQTTFQGQSQIKIAMKGSYRAATGEAPDLSVRLWVHDGLIDHNKAPAPFRNFWVNSTISIPGLNPDSLSLAIDTLQFKLNGAPTSATFFLKGLDQPYIKADLNSNIDLTLLDRALGLPSYDLRGQLQLKASVDGYYRTGQNPDNFRPDTITLSIPRFSLEAGITDGYFKDAALPLAVEQVRGQIKTACSTGKWQDISLAISNFNAAIGSGQLAGNLTVQGLKKSKVQADLNANLRLEDLTRAIPLDSFALAGTLDVQLQAEGRLDAEKRQFPAAAGTLQLKNGRIQTPYYPRPIEQLNINATVDCKSGNYRDLKIQLEPVSFIFEEKPFALNAVLQNPDNLRYDITAKGTLDLGKIYKVFAVTGYDLTGLLQANLDLHGTQADAQAGRYQKLRNSGTLRVQNLELRSQDYPYPFFVPDGTLRFEQDKAWLKNAVFRYRQNVFTLNGYAENFIGHSLQGSVLKGKLSVACPRLVVDDFMVFAGAPEAAPAAPAAPGVVLLPTDMDLSLDAAVQKIIYGQTAFENFRGQLALQQGKLLLQQTQIGIAGATVRMEADYTPVNLRKAIFGFSLKADSFDVKRAYREVPMFREMAGSAEKAEGLVSLEYQLQGRLNDRMEPVYPSVKGQGVLKLEQVKVNGLKLFGAVSKATGRDSINNPELKAVVIKSAVANNIITIERTKMKVFGFRPRIEGQTSLDGRLNLRFRLGLPPLGILGIPMTITGTSDNPEVTIRKGKEADELEEEVDVEQ